ncbi:MAG: hypothetical protein WCC17_04410 [Candidatus Nitrosopolaris sp.]
MKSKYLFLLPAIVSLVLVPTQAHALLGSDCRLLDMQTIWTDGYIFTIHYVTSGHIKNVGWLPSGQIQLQATFTTADTGAVLWTTYFNPVPASLGAGEEGVFTLPFTTDDLGGYKGDFHVHVKIVSE